MSQKSDLNVKRATRSTSVATVPSPVENMATSTISTPHINTTKEPQQVTEGKQSLEAYLKENFDKIQQQLDVIKVTSDETKVEILKSLDFNHAEIRDLKEKNRCSRPYNHWSATSDRSVTYCKQTSKTDHWIGVQ